MRTMPILFVIINIRVLASAIFQRTHSDKQKEGRCANKKCGTVHKPYKNSTIISYYITRFLQVLQRSIKKFKEANQLLILYNASSEVVRRLESIPDVDKIALRASTISDALACVMPTTASTAVFDNAPLLP